MGKIEEIVFKYEKVLSDGFVYYGCPEEDVAALSNEIKDLIINKMEKGTSELANELVSDLMNNDNAIVSMNTYKICKKHITNQQQMVREL